jgi:hypothetical protein
MSHESFRLGPFKLASRGDLSLSALDLENCQENMQVVKVVSYSDFNACIRGSGASELNT